jgi:hypothetical protein
MAENHPEAWREIPRSQLLESVIRAVDGARSLAEEADDWRYAHYCEGVLIPFLEHELEAAEAEEK